MSEEKNDVTLEAFTCAVNDFRSDHASFFGRNPEKNEKDLKKWADAEAKRILEKYEPLLSVLSAPEKPLCLTLIGRVHNAGDEFSKQAEEFLLKAVKTNPKLPDAWNELGECYYKADQIDKALNCFESALKYVKDATALRNISKILRRRDRISKQNLKTSIEKSHEALELNLNDGASWFNLGNAYLTAFFHGGESEKVIAQALSCYRKALEDKTQQLDPDLHYSLAEASSYTEDFQTALDSYVRSYALNPSWKVPSDKADELETYLKEVSDAVQTKGKSKQRKLEQLLKSLKPHHHSVFPNLPKKKVEDLRHAKEFGSSEWQIVLKVVTTLSNRALSFTCCAIDEDMDCVAVSVFNLNETKTFLVGDTLVITNPEVKIHKIKLRNQEEVSFMALRVDDPRNAAVNGRKLTDQCLSPVTLVNSVYHS